jgi:endonuclease YncB( thermonuclease family)
MKFALPKMSNPLKLLFGEKQINNPLFTENKININYMEDGTDIKWEDTVEFTFPITGGRVIKVYDADTITIASKLPYDESPMYRLSVRLNGIDTPEIKGKGISFMESDNNWHYRAPNKVELKLAYKELGL